MAYIKHFIWFINESANFLDKSKLWVLTHGLIKAHKNSVFMCKWDKLTPEQRENWYINREG